MQWPKTQQDEVLFGHPIFCFHGRDEWWPLPNSCPQGMSENGLDPEQFPKLCSYTVLFWVGKTNFPENGADSNKSGCSAFVLTVLSAWCSKKKWLADSGWFPHQFPSFDALQFFIPQIQRKRRHLRSPYKKNRDLLQRSGRLAKPWPSSFFNQRHISCWHWSCNQRLSGKHNICQGMASSQLGHDMSVEVETLGPTRCCL